MLQLYYNFMPKKLLKIFITFLIFGSLFYRYFLYIDFKNDCYIKLKPSFLELSSTNIKQGIKILKLVSPDEYTYFCQHVKVINPNYACGGLGGGCYYSNNLEKKEIDISTANGGYLGQTAAVIAHEACHAQQHQEGRDLNEQECYLVDDKVFRQIAEY